MKKKDLILICSVLVLAAAFWLIPRAVGIFGNSKAQKLRITVSGKEYGVYSLDEDQVIKIGDTNVCEIKDKKVTMISAECPDQLCIHQGPICLQGETIVCLPNKVVLEVTGMKQTDKEALDEIVN
nr:NusG domain II-containing protein [uncultured Blautia sp.]